MVQREIKNKTKLYTVAAILSAIILVSAIYTVTPIAVLNSTFDGSPMKNFTSNNELRRYLMANTQETLGYFSSAPIDSGDGNAFQSGEPVGDVAASVGLTGTSSSSPTGGYGDSPVEYWRSPTSQDIFSTTNTQVLGVDEADIVKTDGQYIYTLSRYGTPRTPTIQIVKATSKNPTVVGKIAFDNSICVDGMYLSENGNKLALIGKIYDNNNGTSYPYGNVQTFLYVYDVSSKAEPVLVRNLTLSGNYFNSRMIGNYVYTVVNQQAYVDGRTVVLPQICVDAVTTEIASTSIYYTDMKDTYFSYSTFVGLNIIDDAEKPTYMTILTGASSCMYVSINNMYVIFGKSEDTEIYRISFNGANMNFGAQGIVPGRVLNQYSMDEYNSYFRIATTVFTGAWPNREGEHNNLYVLDMNLDMVGKLENLAQGERIYSARFAGDKAYLVTFKQIDPFFVLDLKDPASPKVAGELKIPGFSNYLHPYNENYVIGIGREDRVVKLSLFDVTDLNNPTEVAKYLIGENAATVSSNAAYEPKAFLFDLQKQLLVIQVTTYTNYKNSEYPANGAYVFGKFNENNPIYETHLWRGVYVFKLSPKNGFILQGELSHQTGGNYRYFPADETITRSLYIGNTLYTISDARIQLHSLDNLELIAQVNF